MDEAGFLQTDDEVTFPRNYNDFRQMLVGGRFSAEDVSDKHMLHLLLIYQENMIVESRRRERRHYLFEQRILHEIDGLRGQVRALSSDAPASFPRFQRLPKEIKEMVWALAIPRRAYSYKKPRKYFGITSLPAPAITQVCTESRAVALRYGRYYPVRQSRGCLDSSWQSFICWSWFSPDHDVLLREPVNDVHEATDKAAKSLFLECSEYKPQRFMDPAIFIRRPLAQHMDRFPKLETVYVGCRFFIGRSMSASAVSELFHGDEALLVNMEDATAVRRVSRILERERGRVLGPRFELNRYSKDMDLQLTILREYLSEYEAALPRLKNWFIKGRAKYDRLPLSSESQGNIITADGPNTDIGWVREALESFKFRPAVLFVPEHTPSGKSDWVWESEEENEALVPFEDEWLHGSSSQATE